MRDVPTVNVHHTVAPVGFHNRRYQRYHVAAYGFNVWGFIYCETIGQFHEGRRRAGFGGVNRTRDVINRHGGIDERLSAGVVHLQLTRVSQLL